MISKDYVLGTRLNRILCDVEAHLELEFDLLTSYNVPVDVFQVKLVGRIARYLSS